MSTITSPSRISKDVDSNTKEKPKLPDIKLESRLNIKDLEALQDAFMEEGEGYDNRLSLTKEQFCEAMSLILNKGQREEYAELFDKIDVTKEGSVDWDKFASHMLLEFYERDDRVKSTQVPQWKDIKNLPSPHKEVIQKVTYLKNTNRYIAISKEGSVSMWSQNLKLQRSLKTGTDSCRARDLWVTNFTPLHNINKIALSFTSKEIAVYDLSTKLEFNCQYKIQGLDYTPITLDYWSDPSNPNEAILVWGDTGGSVNAIHFTSANIALFERPAAPAGEKQEPCLNVQLKDIAKRKYKNSRFMKHTGHTEWVRQVVYSSQLECFISCATTWKDSLVIGWLERQSGTIKPNMKLTTFQISQGVNAFDYHEQLNLIATAGVNHHVCLWNPYVVSKPNGVLRGHMAGVIQVQFNKPRGQLISFSKDKVLRIWDVQLQVCIQRLAGMFPKGPEVFSTLYFDDRLNRLFVTFNYQLTLLEMKVEIKDRIMSHDKPVVAALYNSTYNQIVSVCQGGNLTVWMIDTGQKVKTFPCSHGDSEVTCLAQDTSETRLYTGSTDGTVKMWDFNGHCYHTLQCGPEGQPADIGQILVLKRSVLVVGWTKYICVFRTQNFKDFHVEPSDWKGGQEHADDILALSFSPPNTLASGAYDGEVVVWNNNSEQASRHMIQRSRRKVNRSKTFMTRENTAISQPGSTAEGFDSHSFITERPKSKSRAASRVSEGTSDESNEYGFAIARLCFLESRKSNSASGGANLISCGGNGWVRFWNTANNKLIGEFPAHSQVGSVIMTVDKDNNYLATADVDGLVKTWDIAEYCMREEEGVITEPPAQISSFQPHSDMVTSISICERNERTLVLTSSSDCSVAMWDVHGNQIGIYGQDTHWKIEPHVQKDEEDETNQQDYEEKVIVEVEGDRDSDWEPDDRAVNDPSNHRINTWDSTVLGKDYQELRVKKRERRQPGVIADLPYLHWEKTGDPPAGPYAQNLAPVCPYAALDTPALDQVGEIEKPDFVSNPHKYFAQRTASAEKLTRLPALAETLNKAFDENTLFPTYILDFESKMKRSHQKQLQDATKKAGTGLLKNVLGPKTGNESISFDKRSTITSPGKRSHKPGKLKPLSVKSGSFKDD